MKDCKPRSAPAGDGGRLEVDHLQRPLICLEGVVPLLGRITQAFAEQEFAQAVDQTLDLICDALDADNTEIFFSEPEGEDLLLTACRGPDQYALVEQTRFEPGTGFPGRVTTDLQPVSSIDLADDTRYLRRSVVQCGINAYACVPLRAPRGLRGSLNAAWRIPPENLDHAVELLELVASVISTQIAARLSVLRCAVDHAMESKADEALEERLRILLQLVVKMTDAPQAAARVLMADGQDVVVNHDLSCECEPSARPSACPCDIVKGGHGDLVESDSPCPCRLPRMMKNPCRLSMTYGGETLGCLVVDLGQQPQESDRPATGQLLPLLITVQQAALHIRNCTAAAPDSTDHLPYGADESIRELELSVLGPCRILRRGELLEPEQFGRRAALDLLQVLALHWGTPKSADQLVEILWPRTDFATAKNRLHVAFHALRAVLEPQGKRGNWQLVRNHHGQYFLDDSSAVWLDSAEFHSLWKQVQRLRSSGAAEEKWMGPLQQMLDLYRGDLFAENIYEDWGDSRRVFLRRIFLEGTGLLVNLLVERGRFEAAIDRLRMGLAIDELDDVLNRRLIEVLLAMGRRQRAEEHYEYYARRLHEELDCEPLPETLELQDLLILARQDFDAALGKLTSRHH